MRYVYRKQPTGSLGVSYPVEQIVGLEAVQVATAASEAVAVELVDLLNEAAEARAVRAIDEAVGAERVADFHDGPEDACAECAGPAPDTFNLPPQPPGTTIVVNLG